MKIIAKIDDCRVLCEVDVDEVARLHGVPRGIGSNFNRDWMTVGEELDLSRAIATLEAMRALDSNDLDKVLKMMDNVQETYKKIIAQQQKIMLFDKIRSVESTAQED